ncbi:MAG: hypothetical protein HYV52_02025 [Parcubacteria group bacterium]|nr:hypothetical protein [Parcubacteria group bacterium]
MTGLTSFVTTVSSIYDQIANEDSIFATAAKYALLVAGTLIMNQITNDMINWINNGFDGKPGFVQNPEGLIKKVGDQAAGSILTTLAGNQLCEPFKLNIQIPLQEVSSFNDEVQCTLTKIVENIDSFYDDFSTGGWLAWVHLTKPQNNAISSYLMIQDESARQESKSTKNTFDEINRNQGYYSVKECSASFDSIDVPTGEKNGVRTLTGKTQENIWDQVAKAVTDSGGETVYRIKGEIQCSTKTPAQVVSGTLNETITGGNKIMQQSISDLTASLGLQGSFFQPFITAMLNALINKGVMEGLAAAQTALTNTESSPINSVPSDEAVDDSTLVDTTRSDIAQVESIKRSLNPGLKQQLSLVSDALIPAIDVAGQIQQTEINILETEGKMAAINEALVKGGRAASCVFPTDTTDRTITTIITSTNATYPNATALDDKMARTIDVNVTDSKYGKGTPATTLRIITATAQTTDLFGNTFVNVGVNSVTAISSPQYQTPIDAALSNYTTEKTSADNALNNIDPTMTSLQIYLDNADSFIEIGNANVQAGTTIAQSDKDTLQQNKDNALNSLAPIISPETANDFSSYNSKISDLNVETFDRADNINREVGSSSSTDPLTLYGQLNDASGALASIQSSYAACAAF